MFSRKEIYILLFIAFELLLILVYVFSQQQKNAPYSSDVDLRQNNVKQKHKSNELTAQHTLREKIRKEIEEDQKKIDWWKQNFTEDENDHLLNRCKVILIVSSAPQRFKRRAAIRQTWWTICKNSTEVECLFFTDGVLDDKDVLSGLIEENRAHRDLKIQPLNGGVNFGIRFLYQLRWIFLHYNFQYFMKLDDDQFLCFDRLLHDLETLPKNNFIWSWVHCEKGLVRPEESFLVISHDIVEKFLQQNTLTIKCHPLADQQLATWIHELQLSGLYYHDPRIHHHPPAASLPEMLNIHDVCNKYIAIHGSYPAEMKYYWDNKGFSKSWKETLLVKPLKTYCPYGEYMNWQGFDAKWIFEPRPCVENHAWNTDKLMENNINKEFYGGRENELLLEDPKYLIKRFEEKKSQVNQCERQQAKLLAENTELLRQVKLYQHKSDVSIVTKESS